MSKRFVGIASSIIEHGLMRKGVASPSRVWHIDKKTGKRTLLLDNTEEFSKAKSEYEKLQSFEPKSEVVSE